MKLCTNLVINTIHKNFSVFDWCKTIDFDNCDHHQKVTRIRSDTAVCLQTNHGCCDVMHTTEYSGTNGSLE